MTPRVGASGGRLFAVFAALALVPVLALGIVLGAQSQDEAQKHGLDEGRSQALVLSRVISETLLDNSAINGALPPAEDSKLREFARVEVSEGGVLRLRLRGLDQRVAFSSDGSGTVAAADDEVRDALAGTTSAIITRLNSDPNDVGPVGPTVVEVYSPMVNFDDKVIGVLEIYVPYAPIAADLAGGQRHLYLTLALGLLALYVVLAGLAGWMARRLSRHAAEFAHLALHDSLTGLPNRALFRDRVAMAIATSARGGPGSAIALIDLDRFKEVNDTLGHHNGDLLLIALADRLSAAVRGVDTVARLGGDEFAIILAGVATPLGARQSLERVHAAIEQEMELAGLPLSLDASVGVVFTPADGDDPDTLLQRADVAMYVAKRGQAGVVFYDPAHDDYNAERLALVAELRRAIERDELRLHYQPKATLPGGEVNGVEALVRWQHPTRGLLAPDEFVPIAEQTGLIEPLTQWVLDTALAQLDAWRTTEPQLGMSVNISARSLQRSDLPHVVADALRRTGVDPRRLVLEVTETALVTDAVSAGEVLRRLAAMGVALSLDDFGQGFTNLGQLRHLPLTELKIDKSFVFNMTTNPSDAAIVRSVIELGHNLGMSVVAEGVETQEALAALTELGCDRAQGYWICRPAAADVIATWFSARRVAAVISGEAAESVGSVVQGL